MIELLEDKSSDSLTLSIEDNGKGMDRKTANRAVDPFFTTKDSKKAGLGLTLLSQAARQAVRMITRGEVETLDGQIVPMCIDTLCIHGDTPGAVRIAEPMVGRVGVLVAVGAATDAVLA